LIIQKEAAQLAFWTASYPFSDAYRLEGSLFIKHEAFSNSKMLEWSVLNFCNAHKKINGIIGI
jgi:hypothetical protein